MNNNCRWRILIIYILLIIHPFSIYILLIFHPFSIYILLNFRGKIICKTLNPIDENQQCQNNDF